MTDKQFENLAIIFVLIFFLGSGLIWIIEKEEINEKKAKIERQKDSINQKLEERLNFIDSIIELED